MFRVAIPLCVCLTSCRCITGQVLYWLVAILYEYDHASQPCMQCFSVQPAKGDLPSDSPATLLYASKETLFIWLRNIHYIYWLKPERDAFNMTLIIFLIFEDFPFSPCLYFYLFIYFLVDTFSPSLSFFPPLKLIYMFYFYSLVS